MSVVLGPRRSISNASIPNADELAYRSMKHDCGVMVLTALAQASGVGESWYRNAQDLETLTTLFQVLRSVETNTMAACSEAHTKLLTEIMKLSVWRDVRCGLYSGIVVPRTSGTRPDTATGNQALKLLPNLRQEISKWLLN